jgi:N-acetylglucosaminyldiphosphoundecaprenol N-acetyl-beta-D-mannosaminyltransferase
VLRSDLPRAWMMGVGISFSFVAGRVSRAPRWMQQIGLEWVWRLAQEPRRLARRYLIEDLPFSAELFLRAAWKRLRRRA